MPGPCAAALALTRLPCTAQLPVGSFSADYSAGKGRAQVIAVLDAAAADGLNFVRMWAFTVTCGIATLACSESLLTTGCSQQFPLQLAPSVYDERILHGLDFVLHQAMLRNIFVVLVLADWW